MNVLPLMLILSLDDPPAIFEATGKYAIEATVESTESRPGVDPPRSRTASNDVSVDPPGPVIRLQIWSASWCRYCGPAKAEAQKAADELGVRLEVFDLDRHRDIARRIGVSSVPTTYVVVDGKLSAGRKFVGFTSRERIVSVARATRAKTVTRTVTRSRIEIDAENHLRSDHGIDTSGLSLLELERIHDAEHMRLSGGSSSGWHFPGRASLE